MSWRRSERSASKKHIKSAAAICFAAAVLFWFTFGGYKITPVGAKPNAPTGVLLYFFELGVVRHYLFCADLFKSYFEHSIIRHFLHTEYHARAVCLMLDRLAD